MLKNTRASARAATARPSRSASQVSAGERRLAAQGAYFSPAGAVTYSRAATGAKAYRWAKTANAALARDGDLVAAIREASREIAGARR